MLKDSSSAHEELMTKWLRHNIVVIATLQKLSLEPVCLGNGHGFRFFVCYSMKLADRILLSSSY
jgi:hypothetical protein